MLLEKSVENVYNIPVMSEVIPVKCAREHNLNDMDVDIPRNKLVVITGLSGRANSRWLLTLSMPRGKRHYVESLSR